MAWLSGEKDVQSYRPERSLLSLAGSYDIGVVSGALISLTEDFGLTADAEGPRSFPLCLLAACLSVSCPSPLLISAVCCQGLWWQC